MQLISSVATSSSYMGFNMRDPVIGQGNDKATYLRQAISIAIDYEEQIAIFLNGRGVVAQGLIPPGIAGASTDCNPITHVGEAGQCQRRPLADAKALMAKAGYADGIDPATGKALVLYYDTVSTGADDKAQLDWMRKQFAKLGIQLVIRSTDYNRFQEKML
ncbi:MAG TPA: ABC transporter substrate-binding protein, partial [Thiotrichales bacterium]|nr:ABC transporter substrate-binding protein [Thiotrichales bacterium]